jgi:hypothetical protein
MENIKQPQDIGQVDGGGDRVAGFAGPGPADDFQFLGEDLAKSVTRQVQISGPSNWKHLLAGVDSLDLGLYIEWPERWEEIRKSLAEGKEAAAGTKGIRWYGAPHEQCLVLPSGKPPTYSFHLQTPDFHLFVAKSRSASKYPTVYASPLAQSLWLCGVIPTVRKIGEFIHRLGGRVERMQVSRCDLSADFLIPAGLTLDFLRETKVARARAWRPFCEGDSLQTFYVGGNGAELQCRIYDKALEVAHDGLKAWFIDLWKVEELKDVWRVEFQLRRPVLKQFGIDTIEDLIKLSGGVWESLTSNWLSFRFDDDPNATRRTVHPWWQAVQAVSLDFGSEIAVERNYDRPKTAPAEWFVSHGSGCLPGYAARKNLSDFGAALDAFIGDAKRYWADRDFCERYRLERIALGFDDTNGEAAA